MSEHVVDQRDAVLRHVQEAKDGGLKYMGFLGNNSYTCERISYHYLEDAFFCGSCLSCSLTKASSLCTSYEPVSYNRRCRVANSDLQGPRVPGYC
ncbi:hypothetical protein CEXT_269461 [Caerostris extrusa]|uniref:Uncharacterized protein n=1 Tax=Caerostris extrusa TaxID=172846 RepID=A0AAV4SGG1_CAEEX|nr:hypothetical protein CEXT_269461 [Caerostris extrusa]